MSDGESKPGKRKAAFAREVARRGALRRKHERDGDASFWSSVGMMGTIGWTVSLPTALGVLFGRWLDTRLDAGHVFMVFFMLFGLGVGCFTAWRNITERI